MPALINHVQCKQLNMPSTLQILTHVREKLQFIAKENTTLATKLDELDQELAGRPVHCCLDCWRIGTCASVPLTPLVYCPDYMSVPAWCWPWLRAPGFTDCVAE